MLFFQLHWLYWDGEILLFSCYIHDVKHGWPVTTAKIRANLHLITVSIVYKIQLKNIAQP